MGHRGGCGRTATASGCGERVLGRGKKEEARNFSISRSLVLSVDLPLIALIHLTTKN